MTARKRLNIKLYVQYIACLVWNTQVFKCQQDFSMNQLIIFAAAEHTVRISFIPNV